MNYVVVFAAFFTAMLVIIWYGYAKKRYRGPKVSSGASCIKSSHELMIE